MKKGIHNPWTNGGPNRGDKPIEIASNDDRLLRKDELSCSRVSYCEMQ